MKPSFWSLNISRFCIGNPMDFRFLFIETLNYPFLFSSFFNYNSSANSLPPNWLLIAWSHSFLNIFCNVVLDIVLVIGAILLHLKHVSLVHLVADPVSYEYTTVREPDLSISVV